MQKMLLPLIAAVVVASCSDGNSIPDEEGHALYSAARVGTGCASADQRILHWADRPGGGYDDSTAADRLGDASMEYGKCAKSARPPQRKARYLIYAAMAVDEAAIRYQTAGDIDVASAASGSGKYVIDQIRSTAYTHDADIDDLLSLADTSVTRHYYDIEKAAR
jgi:hypothetical protein